MADGDSYEKNVLMGSSETIHNYSNTVRGAQHYDWGMKNRLASIFSPQSGKTVMLAFDHGYIMGPTSGLERLDLAIPPLIDYIDVLMATRGGIRTCINPAMKKAITLRCSAGSSVLTDEMSLEIIGVDIQDAVRMNAACMAIQVFIGSPNECQTINNLCSAVNKGMQYGLPVLGVVAVGKQMERTTKYFQLATRMIAEFGAQIVKSYYCDNFESVVNSCPVPIVIAGGKKIPEDEALTMTFRAISEGASGVDMGRNIFQAKSPKGMAKAIASIVHGELDDKEAYEQYLDFVNGNSEMK